MIIYVLTIAADTGIWHTVSQPKQIESVRDCRPKLFNSTWGYTVISNEGIPVNRLFFLFFFCTLVMEEGRHKSKRLSYTAKFKHEVIRCAEDKGNRKAAANFGVDKLHSTVAETQGSDQRV
jgi:hypothetical protein